MTFYCYEFELKDNYNINGRNFNVACYYIDLNNNQHLRLFQQIVREGEVLANKVIPTAANNLETRDRERIRHNCIAGMFAEYCWKDYLNKKYGNNFVANTQFQGASNQIDLITERRNLKIEVRSSFVRNGIKFALFHPKYHFDVLGPYSKHVNEKEYPEPQKDFYVRTLFSMTPTDYFDLLLDRKFKIYLTGGATWDMMKDNSKSYDKELIPEDEIKVTKEKNRYRVVPLPKALDTKKIAEMIFNSDIKGNMFT